MQLNCKIFWKYLGKVKIIWETTEKCLGNKKFLEHKKPTTLQDRVSKPRKKLRFEVKIFFRDHYFFGIKIKKSVTDFK